MEKVKSDYVPVVSACASHYVPVASAIGLPGRPILSCGETVVMELGRSAEK